MDSKDRKRARKSTGPRRARQSDKKASKKLTKIAKKEVSKLIEKKDIRTTPNILAIVQAESPNFDSQSVIDTSTVLRNIPNGTTSGTRIGSRIKLTRFMLNGVLYQKPDITQPIYLKMWVVSDRFRPENADNGTIEDACKSGLSQPSSSWFANGSGTSGMFGNMQDLNLDVSERFKVHKTRVFKIATSNPTSYHNNDFKLTQRFSINLLKYSPKRVRYLDALSNTWFTRKVFVVFAPVTMDNIADPTKGFVNLHYSINVQYQDA